MATRNKGIPAKRGKKGTPQPKRGPKKVAKSTAKKPARRTSKPKAKKRAATRPIDSAAKVGLNNAAGASAASALSAARFGDACEAEVRRAAPKSWWRRALAWLLGR